MSDTVFCPYCETLNEIETADIGDVNHFDEECVHCEEEFQVNVEITLHFDSEPINYKKCDLCGDETRDPAVKGLIYPFPEKIKAKVLCRPCHWKETVKEMEKR